jgi:seryl-tRNA(Sec) selenium transferase
MKVSKEDICAFVVCLEEFLSVDELDEVATYWRRATYLEHLLSSAARLSVSIKSAHPVTRQGLPRVFLSVDSGSRSASESLFNSMLNGNPAIVLGQYDDGLYIDPLMLDDNHVALIATRILSWVSAAADQSLK